MKNKKKNLREIVREEFKKLGVSQNKFCKEVEFSSSVLSRYLLGGNINDRNLFLLLDKLKIEMIVKTEKEEIKVSI